jgi:hypothetical protein
MMLHLEKGQKLRVGLEGRIIGGRWNFSVQTSMLSLQRIPVTGTLPEKFCGD